MKGRTLKISVLVVLLIFGIAMLGPTILAQSENSKNSPGHTDSTPGKEGTPPGQGGTPPGLGKYLGLSLDGDKVYWEDPDIKVGIGTAYPQYTLDVNGDIHADGSLILGNSVILDPNGYMILDDNTPTLEFYNKDTIPPYTDLFIDSENKFVGIGTKTVVANVRLNVDGNILTTGTITGSGSGLTDVDADTVDGFHAVSFAAASHNHAAGDITTGVLAVARIPDLDANKITSGTFAAARIPGLDASKITSGIFAVTRIPGLDANKITSGTFAAARIPGLDASKITSGTFATARIPNLDASKITSGKLDTARLPANIDADTLDGKDSTEHTIMIPPMSSSQI
jgi:hypothetical protein